MSCDPLFPDSFVFPRRADNRPGLPHVRYRIGRYDEFLAAMRRHIDSAVELSAWTHRQADDPGIALLEGAAIVGDILSFYQEHYANEAFLRTAQWRESVSELVRLTGYRLAPAVGGRATFAIEVRGQAPVTLRKGFPIKADLADVPDAAQFQAAEETIAWPQLSRLNLYRRRLPGPTISAQSKTLELLAVDGHADALSRLAFDLKKGDQLLIVPDENMYSTPGTPWTPQREPQLLKVAKVTPLLGRVQVELEAPPAADWPGVVRAWRIGRSFRHFGHNAPPTVTTADTGSGGVVKGSISVGTRFVRYIYYSDSTFGFGANYTPLSREQMPLDVEAPDFGPGRTLLVQGTMTFTGQSTPTPFIVTRRVTSVRHRTMQWGNLVGASTVLTLDAPLVPNGQVLNEVADIRELRFHEVSSPPLLMLAPLAFRTGAFTGGTDALYFYGTAEEAKPPAGRRLFMQHDDGRSVTLVCTNTEAAFTPPPTAPRAPRMWPLSFDRAPAPFTHDDFDEAEPTVTVFGNLLDATQGKSETEATLGNGDNRQRFQTFPLPAKPLTFFVSAADVPPYRPELEVWVEGRLWTRVDALFGRGPKEQVYIVREDAEGRSFVQFGDGLTGARLPTGLKNVLAVYRTGAGARGPLKPGTTPTAPERPPGFDKVQLAGIVSGGADAEDAAKAREAAPGKVQSLGRIVSLADHETEALIIPGVVRARARWDLHAGVPAVLLCLLLEAGREAEFEAVRAAVAHAQRCRGPNRHPIVAYQALPRHVFVDLTYARDPSHRADTVEAAVRAVLGLVGDADHAREGLFGLHARRIGDPEYASTIESRVQNVAGVLWCRVTAFGRLAAGSPGVVQDPATLTLPALRLRRASVPCSARELLQLHPQHLTLVEAAEPAAGECA